MKIFASKNILFTIVKVNETCNDMIKVMQANYDSADRKLTVSDLASACQHKTSAEVTKEFVSAASYILSAALCKGAKKVKRDKPLWDPKKIANDQWLSQTSYLTVSDISGSKITVEN